MDSDPKAGPLYVARVPMIASAAAFGGGVLLAKYIFHPVWLWLGAALLLGVAAFVLRCRQQYIAYATALAAMACVGGFTAEARNAAPKPVATITRFADARPVVLSGVVMRDGVLRNSGPQAADESLDLQVESVERDGQTVNVSGGARLTLYVASNRQSDETEDEEQTASRALPIYQYGQRVRLAAKLHAPLNYRNPGAFDYSGYLDGLGIQAIGSAKSDSVEIRGGRGGSRFEDLRWTARRRVLAQIHRVWPEEQAALFDAMLIGERGFVSKAMRTEFQRSGTYHILVVSGMNVAIFAVGLYWILRKARAGVEIATVLTILVSVSYALLTDLGAPILRSIAMLAIYQAARVLYRERAALNAVGTAALFLLVWEPRQLFEPSFQLTFLSVIAIAGICLPLLERSTQPRRHALRRLDIKGYDQAFPAKLIQWRIELRMIAERLRRIFGRRIGTALVVGVPSMAISAFELMVVSAAMQVVLAFPMVWYFHRLPVRGFAANLAVVPLVDVLMPASVLAVAISFGSLWLAKLPALIASYALAGIMGTVHALGAAGTHDARLPIPGAIVACFCAATIVGTLLCARRRGFWVGVAVAGLCASTLWLSMPKVAEAKAGVLEVTAIDVGQGESLLIVTPEGKRLLLDSGGQLGFSRSEFDVGEEVTSSYLWNRGIHRLDAVAFSHAHSDHVQGMRAIIANFRPRELWMATDVDNALTRQIEESCREYGVTIVRRAQGDAWDFGAAHFEVLAALRSAVVSSKQLDDTSMVLRASYRHTSILLPGDAHKRVESMLTSGDVTADVLKVAHHGSSTSTSAELLAAVRPSYALISAGRGNAFGHPRSDVLKRLAEAHVRTYRTDLFGPVTLYLDGEKVTPWVPR